MNIFLTVGSQMPFDRLTRAVVQWAREERDGDEAFSPPADEGKATPVPNGPNILAQIGLSSLTSNETQPLRCVKTLAPSDYRQACLDSHLIVAHAGMGSILTAMELNRPLIVMPRRGSRRETRNDHQWDTAMKLLEAAAERLDRVEDTHAQRAAHRIWVAKDEVDLTQTLRQVCRLVPITSVPSAHVVDASPARQSLIENLRGVIQAQASH